MGKPEEEKSLFRHRKQAMGDCQVQAAAVLCVGCEAAADPEVCVVFNAVRGLGEGALSQFVPSESLLMKEGDPHHPLCCLSSPLSVLPSPQLLSGLCLYLLNNFKNDPGKK